MRKLLMSLASLIFCTPACAEFYFSANGRIQVGSTVENFTAGIPFYAVDNGTPIELSVPSGYTGYASRVSLDGTIIAGQLFKNENNIWTNWCGAIWRQTQVVNGIPVYSGPLLLSAVEGRETWMYEMTSDGKYLSGNFRGLSGQDDHPAYWDADGTFHSLGGMYYGSILCDVGTAGYITDSGVILGSIWGEGVPYMLGFIWDSEHGMRYIKDVLQQEYGYDFGDSFLETVYFTNSECTIVEGNGYTATGELFVWQATIPEPATLLLISAGSLFLRRKRI